MQYQLKQIREKLTHVNLVKLFTSITSSVSIIPNDLLKLFQSSSKPIIRDILERLLFRLDADKDG